MARKYGMPYKGSKARIAEWVVSVLPTGRRLVDMFCGGCSVTHCAMLSGRWHDFLINDINGMMPDAFLRAAHGGFKGEDRWISREDFFKLKDTDAYAAICFSFGNDLRTYAYGRDVEALKRAAHFAIFYDDMKAAEELGISGKVKGKDISQRYTSWKTLANGLVGRDSELCSVERLQSIEMLESLQRLESLQSDYRDIEIKEGDVVYCDIPYKGTNEYNCPFDHDAFYKWALSLDFPIFVSEYDMPEGFAPIAMCGLRSIMSANGKQSIMAEKIYTQKPFASRYVSELFI